MEEREIIDKIRRLEDREDEIEASMRQFQREEEEEEDEIFRSISYVDTMGDCCPPNDYEMQSLLDEKRYFLDEIRAQKNEFADEYYAALKKEKRDVEMECEELRYQLNKKQEYVDEIDNER